MAADGRAGGDSQPSVRQDPLGAVRLANPMLREVALTTEITITLQYVLVNGSSEDVVVRLAEVSPACCVAAQQRSPLVLRAGQAKPYELRVRLPVQAEIMGGKCRFVVSTVDKTRLISPKSLPARFRVSVLESVELVGNEEDARLLGAGLCGAAVPVEAELRVRALKGEKVIEDGAAYDLVLVGATGDLEVGDFLGCGEVGGRIVEYRWRVRGRLQLPLVPGVSPPADVIVQAGGKELGRTWVLVRADSRYEVEPRTVVLKCDGTAHEHQFLNVVRNGDGEAARVTKLVCRGPVRASVEQTGEGEYVVRSVLVCGQDSPSYAEVQLHFDSEQQRLVTIPVLHLAVERDSARVEEQGERAVR